MIRITNTLQILMTLTFAAFLSSACATHERFDPAPRMGPDDYPNARPPLSFDSSPTADERAISPDVDFLRADSPEMERAMREFTETGQPPTIVRRSVGTVTFPYGHEYPIIYCKPLRVCQVELQPAERVINVAMGDNERWSSFPMESGPPGRRTAHVVFTPLDAGHTFQTNAIITTDRRVYQVGLISRPDSDGRRKYNRHARFYYPDETVQTWMSDNARKAQEHAAAAAAELAARQSAIPADLYHGYAIEGDEVPWMPIRAFDDGARVFIEMPIATHVTEAPGVWVIDEQGQQNLVNHRFRDGHYIVDKVFSKARLAVGVGNKANSVFITRLKPEEADLAARTASSSNDLAELR